MWLFAMFDLPVTTVEKRRAYTRFRTLLLAHGFCKLQFSVYARYYANEETGDAARRLVRSHLPPEGQVRLLMVTDGQFGKQQVFQGRKAADAEQPLKQFLLF